MTATEIGNWAVAIMMVFAAMVIVALAVFFTVLTAKAIWKEFQRAKEKDRETRRLSG